MMSDIEREGEYDSEIYDYIKISQCRIRLRVVVQLDRLEPNPIHEVPERGRINGGVTILNAPKTSKPRYQE